MMLESATEIRSDRFPVSVMSEQDILGDFPELLRISRKFGGGGIARAG